MKEENNNIYQLESKRRQKTELSKKNGKKKKRKLKKRSIVVLGIFLYIVGFFSYQGFEIYKLKQEQKTMLEAIEVLEKQKAQYEAELNNVNSEEYIEDFARENLRMVKENEKITHYNNGYK